MLVKIFVKHSAITPLIEKFINTKGIKTIYTKNEFPSTHGNINLWHHLIPSFSCTIKPMFWLPCLKCKSETGHFYGMYKPVAFINCVISIFFYQKINAIQFNSMTPTSTESSTHLSVREKRGGKATLHFPKGSASGRFTLHRLKSWEVAAVSSLFGRTEGNFAAASARVWLRS